ncbi:MAG TPA: GNAT family protein [Candidatus Limnocylindria bacterium]|jgi:RimJ/RimL family protein N-acetyltransferase|nr:GNAT family protein [Candidatus Limnocylindria bacterium]
MERPVPIVLEGSRVRLEPLGARHRDDLVAAAAEDPTNGRYLFTDIAVNGWEAWLAEAMEGVADGRYVAWATVDRSSGRAVGSTRFGDIAPEHGRVEIGWTWLAPSAQRTAINTEAKLLQLRHAFDDLGATRVTLKTDARNERSQRAIERLGAVREGVLRHHLRMPDGFLRDTVYYSILVEEWPGVRARLEERLARG